MTYWSKVKKSINHVAKPKGNFRYFEKVQGEIEYKERNLHLESYLKIFLVL